MLAVEARETGLEMRRGCRERILLVPIPVQAAPDPLAAVFSAESRACSAVKEWD